MKSDFVIPKWEVPKGDANLPVKVFKNGSSHEFVFAIDDIAAFVEFTQEFKRYVDMLGMLYRATKRFEAGEVNYANAAKNLDHLTQEIRKMERRTIMEARKFWTFTNIAENPKSITDIEALFGPQGDAYLDMVLECIGAAVLSEAERKNS